MEYEVILFGVGLVLLAMVAGGIYVVCCNRNDKGVDKGQHDADDSDLPDIHYRTGERDCSGAITVERTINVLQTFRVGASRPEKEALDYAMDCIFVAQKLSKYLKGEEDAE